MSLFVSAKYFNRKIKVSALTSFFASPVSFIALKLGAAKIENSYLSEKFISMQLVTVATFNYIHELAMAKGPLEQEGIECFVKDEYTIQANPFYSQALGGIKLQVFEKDVPKAEALLQELGYIESSIKEDYKGDFWVTFRHKTDKIPLLNRLQPIFRFLSILVFASTVILAITYFVTRPTITEYLTRNWCLEKILHNGKVIQPNSYGLRIEFFNDNRCQEIIHIDRRGAITFPGVDSYPAYGYWKLLDDSLIVSRLDTLNNVYEGTYSIEANSSRLILRSVKTTIYCRALNIF